MKHLVPVTGPAAQVMPFIRNSRRPVQLLVFPTFLTEHLVSEQAKASFAKLLKLAEFPHVSELFEATPVQDMRGFTTEFTHKAPDIFILLKNRELYVGFDILNPNPLEMNRQRYCDKLILAFIKKHAGIPPRLTGKLDILLNHLDLFTAIEEEEVTYLIATPPGDAS